MWKRSSNHCILHFLMRRNFVSSSARITSSHNTCWTTSKQQVKFLLSLVNELLFILPTTTTRTLYLAILHQQKVKSTFVALIDFQLYGPYVILLLSLKEHKHHYVKKRQKSQYLLELSWLVLPVDDNVWHSEKLKMNGANRIYFCKELFGLFIKRSSLTTDSSLEESYYVCNLCNCLGVS